METVLFGVLPVLAFLALTTRSVLRGRRAADTARETQESRQKDTGAKPPHRQGGR